jgi:MOSC domain-containing protein YiiM
MKTMRELLAPPAHIEGRVEAVIVRDAARGAARRIEHTQALAGIGLADDRLGQRGVANDSKRQLSLIQQEHLPTIAALARCGAIDAVDLRRNLVVSGINLLSLKNVQVRVGEALIEIVGPCAPCSRMEEILGPGGYAAMRGHGGMTARILEGGVIRVGDAVRVASAAG